jgi:hypothetical protein
MAKINFPNSPILDQEHIVGDRKWKWNGRAWIAVLGISSETTATPTITYVSKTEASITFTVTNNDAEPAIILYEKDDVTPDFNGVEVLGGATSGELSITGLDALTEYTIYASAVGLTKLLSESASITQTTLDRTVTPTINFVSKTDSEIVFTITNNDADEVEVKWEEGNTTPAVNTLTLSGGVTSGNITLSGLTGSTEYIIYASAKSVNKIISLNAILTVTTDEPPTWIEATGGTVLTYELEGVYYKSHTFTSSGNFIVSSLSDQVDKNEVDYLIIGGGGGGGRYGGGGGGGGYRTTFGMSGGNSSPENKVTVTTQGYNITIGGGGGGWVGDAQSGGQAATGSNSSAFEVVSLGGGGGGNYGSSNGSNGRSSGTGGGGGSGSSANNTSGGTGTNGQGFSGGGSSGHYNTLNGGGGGGGGSGQAGFNGSGNGKGGDGLPNILRNGFVEFRGGGGTGNQWEGLNSTPRSGGIGGGGSGFPGGVSRTSEMDGVINTGGGGGGNRDNTPPSPHVAGNGGSGIVIIRYEVGSL